MARLGSGRREGQDHGARDRGRGASRARRRALRRAHRVLGDSAKVPEDEFRGETYPYQASFDEYGRGYAAGARGDPRRTPPAPAAPRRFASAPAAPPRTDPQLVAPDPNGSAAATPDVLVVRAASRTDAVAALREIAEQGEAIEIVEAGSENAHFVRF